MIIHVPEQTEIGSAYLDVSPEVIIEMLKGLLQPGGKARRFEVVENALPKDAKLASVEYDGERKVIKLLIHSRHFEGDYRQLPPPTLKTIP